MPNRVQSHRTPHFARLTLALAVAALLAACGSGGGAPGGGGGPPTNDPVAATLSTLGVATTVSPRVAPDGTVLDDDAPLGGSASFGEIAEFSDQSDAHPHMELVIANDAYISGSTPYDATFQVRKIVGAGVSPTGTIQPGTEEVLFDLSDGNDWVRPDAGTDHFQTLRAVAAGDLDGDGFDEIAGLFVDASDGVLKLRVFDDAASGFTARTSSLAAGASVRGVALIAYDANGDGRDDLAAALSYDERVDLVFLTGSVSTSYAIDASATTTLDQLVDGSLLYVRMDAGQLDYDRGLELGVVVNETTGSSSGTSGLATYYVFDDANAGRALLRSGSVQANVGGTVVAAAADIKLADIDGDGLDEVVMAGATNLAWGCGDDFDALLIALDDKTAGFALLGATVEDLFYQNCPAYGAWKRFFVFLTTPDLDGDGVHEIVANQLVFDNFANAAPFTRLDGVQLPFTAFLTTNTDAGQFMSVATMDMIAADVTGDGRQNVLLYHQNRAAMPVWGLSAVSTIGDEGNGWAQLSALATPGTVNPGGRARPIVVPANVDADGPVLKYELGSHELIYTEPIVIAALAAPPCQEGIAQNLNACFTRFGQGSSSTTEKSLTLSMRAGVTVGMNLSGNIPIVGDIGGSIRKTVTGIARGWAGDAYTVEKTVTYTTGPLEDAVIFTSIPFDVYRYTLVSHPDPDLVGAEVVVHVPREPVTMLAERSYYNAALETGAMRIGANVFDHTPGDVSSYPSASRKNALLSTHGGLQIGPVPVDEGLGNREQKIDVRDEFRVGGSLALEYEKRVEGTNGVGILGFTTGYGAEAALTVTSGTTTTYVGVVGNIAAADHKSNAYSWGMFTYVQDLGDDSFNVINYWVQ